LRALARRSLLLSAAVPAFRSAVADYRAQTQRLAWQKSRAVIIDNYLETEETPRLQIGTGDNVLCGWLNTDVRPLLETIVFLDATTTFPFADGAFDYVFSEHVIEHISYLEARFMLGECLRVLRPEGRLRIATPSLENILGLCPESTTDVQQRYVQWVTDRYLPDLGEYLGAAVVNNMFRGFGHQFLFDRRTLEVALRKSGFVDIVACSPGQSDHSVLQGIEGHGRVIGEDFNRLETMVLEARRPGPGVASGRAHRQDYPRECSPSLS
jgi:predicted SAM-dependent methyltransferase